MRQGRHQADRGETEKLFTPDFYLGEVFIHLIHFFSAYIHKNKTAKQEFSMNFVVRDFTERGLFYVSVRNTYVYFDDVHTIRYTLFQNFHQWPCKTCRKKLKNLKIDL